MEEDYSDEGKSELNDIIFWINQSKVEDISELHESLKPSNTWHNGKSSFSVFFSTVLMSATTLFFCAC